MKWARICEEYMDGSKYVDRYECGEFTIKCVRGSISNNNATFNLYNKGEYVDTFLTLREAKEWAEYLNK